MSDRCLHCIHYDPYGTGLPICKLHKRYMHADWLCADFERRLNG